MTRKGMTIGEMGLSIIFAVLALFTLFIAAKAWTAAYAFHAYLFAAASIGAIYLIVNNYFERPAELPAQMINGKPNYNFGPVKFATIASVFWGCAGFIVGLYIALELAFPAPRRAR